MRAAGWLTVVLLAVLVVHVPAFVCMPQDYDVSQFDVVTRTLLTGQVLYRDVMENNLPGMLLGQAPVRALCGWSSEAIRLADLLVVGSCAWLLVRLLPKETALSAKVGTLFVLLSFYLTTNEWCHAQRDTWMLFPVLLAFNLRRAACSAAEPSPWRTLVSRSFLEGLLWGVAVWIKPFVFVAALSSWLTSLALMRRAALPWTRAALDAAGLFLGGSCAGAAGLIYLWASGAWPAFYDVVFVWNREYVRFDLTEGTGTRAWVGLGLRFFPWVVLHLVAVPLAVDRLRRRGDPAQANATVLLSGLYLGWLFQAVLLQHLFDYVQVAPLLLAITLVCQEAVRPARPGSSGWLLPLLLTGCVLFGLVPLTLRRLPLLPACLTSGSTPELRDSLGLLPHRVDWRSLAEVERHLRQQGVADGELGCLNMGCASLFLRLDVRPATRFVVYQNVVVIFARQRPRIFAEIESSRQRYLVVDVERTLWKADEPPPADERVVFVSGRYRVYAMSGPEFPAWATTHLKLPAGE